MSPSPFYESAVEEAKAARLVGRKERMDERMAQAKEWRRRENARLAENADRVRVRRLLAADGIKLIPLPELASSRSSESAGVSKRAKRAASKKQAMKAWDRDFASALRRIKAQARRAAEAEERAEAEQRRLASLMRSAPGASTAHRGTKSTYNTADRSTVRREPDAPRERLTDGRVHPVKVARASDSGRMRP